MLTKQVYVLLQQTCVIAAVCQPPWRAVPTASVAVCPVSTWDEITTAKSVVVIVNVLPTPSVPLTVSSSTIDVPVMLVTSATVLLLVSQALWPIAPNKLSVVSHVIDSPPVMSTMDAAGVVLASMEMDTPIVTSIAISVLLRLSVCLNRASAYARLDIQEMVFAFAGQLLVKVSASFKVLPILSRPNRIQHSFF